MQDFAKEIRDGVAVVTGASDGLGKALSLELMSQGVRVAGLARQADRLADIAKTAPKGLFYPATADVSDPEAVEQAFAALRKNLGAVTLLINNAAVYPHRDILDETTESFMQTMAINLGGAFSCSRAALSDMTDQGYGRIINVGSFADIAPAPVSSAYSVSKGAARILTRALIADLQDRFPEIVINDWMPGVLNTKMGLPDGNAPELSAKWGVRLALMHGRELTGLVFDGDRSMLPQKSFKRRIFERLMGQRDTPILLD